MIFSFYFTVKIPSLNLQLKNFKNCSFKFKIMKAFYFHEATWVNNSIWEYDTCEIESSHFNLEYSVLYGRSHRVEQFPTYQLKILICSILAVHGYLCGIYFFLDRPWTSENSSFENLLVGEKTAIDLDRQRKKQKIDQRKEKERLKGSK